MNKSGVLLLALATLFHPLGLYGASPLRVKTSAGEIQGSREGKIRKFLGIPYAAPPVGDLRWKPPVPAAQWTGVRQATSFAARCMQSRVYSDMIFRDPGISEDCLYLNVWTPAKNAQAHLPVMVWIYGGGFVAGSTSEPRQDGANLAKHGVVVVSMNYRLGVFGFLVLPALAAESGRNSAGDYGLLDQVAALRWVHDNIAAFGGDPGNVTIFGESAGSFSVSALMASPLCKGLFEKAIGESGAGFSKTSLRFAPLALREEKDAHRVKEKLGVDTLAELRALPAQKLLDTFPTSEGISFTPGIDGYFLPESLPSIFAAGKQNDVPLLAGWNRDEGSSEMANVPENLAIARLEATADQNFGDQSAEFLRLYPGSTEAEAFRSLEDYEGDHFLVWATWKWIEAQATTGKQPTYRYRFDLGQPDPKTGQRIAFHSSEIDYVFGQLDARPGVRWTKQDRRLSQEMQKYWSNFAKNGDPNGRGLAHWPVYSAQDGWEVMHLDQPSVARKDAVRDRYLFLSKVWDKD